jgi:hypothetical protein
MDAPTVTETKPGEDAPAATAMANAIPPSRARQEKRLDEAGLRPSEERRLARRLEKVFVPHPRLEKFLTAQGKSDRRVIVIAGDKGSGRFACAVWLGWKLTKQERVARLPEETFLRYDLGELARSQRLRPRSAYIIREPFKSGISPESLSDLQLDPLNDQLRRLKSWVILTAEEEVGKPSHKRFPWFSIPKASPEFLANVLSQHLDWARPEGSELPQKVEDAAKDYVRDHSDDPKALLNTAPLIYRFSRSLLATDFPADAANIKKALAQLAADVADESRPQQAWFAGLSTNAQFLALLVGAFEGIHRSDLEDIYYGEVLRVRGRSRVGLFKDPRQKGFEELFRQIQVDSADGDLKFIRESCRREVIRQMGFRHHLLWEVVKSIESWMKALDEPWQWAERGLLGRAVGRLGIHRPEKLKLLLLELAAAEQATIASIPGHILRGICFLDDPQYDFVCELLEEWVAPGPPGTPHRGADDAALIWAAADATQRIYVDLAERKELASSEGESNRISDVLGWLEKILGEIAGSRQRYIDARDRPWAKYEFDNALANAVLAMFRSRPGEIVTALLGWLNVPPSVQEKGETNETTEPPKEVIKAEEEKNSSGLEAATTTNRNPSRDLARMAEFVTTRLFKDHRHAEFLSSERRDALIKLVGPILRNDRGVVNGILDILQDWVRTAAAANLLSGGPKGDAELATPGKQWRDPIGTALLKACNRMSERQRRGLRRSLTTLWLASPEAEVRATAQLVICRARLLEGVPTDLSGASWGGVFVDSSAAGREKDTSPRLVQEVFELLRPQVDLWMAQPGNREELCRRGESLNPHELPSRPHALRVVAPWLEQLAREEEALAAFYLAISWSDLIDGEDAEEAAGEAPLRIVMVEGHQEDETRPLPLSFRLLGIPKAWISVLNEIFFESKLLEVEQEVSPCLSRRLAARDAEKWWQLLSELDEFAGAASDTADRRAQAEKVFENLADNLEDADSPEQFPYAAGRSRLPQDPIRLALGVVQWLAADDLPATTRLLLLWMKGKAGPRQAIAGAAAIMLLRIHYERMLASKGVSVGAAPPVDDFVALLDFGPALARGRSGLGVDVFLRAARHWITDPGWATALMKDAKLYDAEKGSSKLLAMSAALPPWLRRNVADALRDWIEQGPLTSLDEKEVPEAAHALSLRLRYDMALRTRFRVDPDEIDNGPLKEFGLVVLSTDVTDEAGCNCVRNLIWDHLYSRWERERLPMLENYLFVEAGRRAPLAVSREEAKREAFDVKPPLVATLAPLLESLNPQLVKFVVVIANRHIVDLQELPEWLVDREKLQLFWVKPAGQPRPAAPSPITWTDFDSDSASQEENGRRLREKLKTYLQTA